MYLGDLSLVDIDGVDMLDDTGILSNRFDLADDF